MSQTIFSNFQLIFWGIRCIRWSSLFSLSKYSFQPLLKESLSCRVAIKNKFLILPLNLFFSMIWLQQVTNDKWAHSAEYDCLSADSVWIGISFNRKWSPSHNWSKSLKIIVEFENIEFIGQKSLHKQINAYFSSTRPGVKLITNP